jgi:5-methyltetrahydrofolate--homocysteine methyltransferase
MFSIVESFGHAQTITWADVYAPGRCEMVQCDFAVMLSPEMFERFVMPYLRRMTGYMDRSCYHLDGTPQTRFLEQLCSLPKLHAIQWNPEPPAPPPLEWLGFFREVRRRGRSLWIACDGDTAIELTRALGPDGLMLHVGGVETTDALDELLVRLEAAST